jgi:hypothetical protein
MGGLGKGMAFGGVSRANNLWFGKEKSVPAFYDGF